MFLVVRVDNEVVEAFGITDEYDEVEFRLDDKFFTDEDIKKIRFSIDDVRDNKRVYFQNEAIHLCCKLSRVEIAIEDKEIDF